MKKNGVNLGSARRDGRPAAPARPRSRRLDAVDRRLIELLQRDGRISHSELARQIGISEATVRSRLQRLIREEILQVVAVSNPLKLGFGVVGSLRIEVEVRHLERILRELQAIPCLWHIVQTTGAGAVDAEFVLQNLEELRILLYERIARIEGVRRTETTLFLNYVKRRYDWGTAFA
ncbi:MAG: Lrp/AsnC family transcriptional regulator [Desulfobacterales bacterium]